MGLVDDSRIPRLPYPQLREVLSIFVAENQAELGENLIGVYLVGSLATGGFDLDSDVDFLVVTHAGLTDRPLPKPSRAPSTSGTRSLDSPLPS
jgi:predicted nucleotidyltransferase